MWGLLPGYELPNGKQHYPLAAMVTNLAKLMPERHDDVTTFFLFAIPGHSGRVRLRGGTIANAGELDSHRVGLKTIRTL